MSFKLNEQALEMLDGPWLRRQVETHLIFGPFSRHFGFCWIVVFLCAANLIRSTLMPLNGVRVAEIVDQAFILAILLLLLKMSVYRQAAVAWCVFKFTLAICCFAALIAGGLVGFFRQSPDAVHMTALSLLWFPVWEFLPRLKEKQKFITAFRILITPVIAYFGYQTGMWHW
jgi:hypothetical protein